MRNGTHSISHGALEKMGGTCPSKLCRTYPLCGYEGGSLTLGLQAFQQAIEAHQGVWERVMGGIFFVHLPPDANFDPEVTLKHDVSQDTFRFSLR